MLFGGLLSYLLLALPVLAASIPKRQSSYFYTGHDLSSLLLLEQTGSIYKDTARQNATRPAEAILADGGMNSVRLRYKQESLPYPKIKTLTAM